MVIKVMLLECLVYSVPQIKILGPTLFLLNINDLTSMLPNCHVILFIFMLMILNCLNRLRMRMA